ncbi:MAG: ribonuclease D [Pirellulaceae bacterium]|nr:MAG: ribonuclease D [Pirellulaceae bacterium]
MSREKNLEYMLIDDAQGFADALEVLQAAPSIAYDTEFVAEDCYQPDLCLVQLATRERVFLIDPKAGFSLDAVWNLLSDPERRVIVHAGREEILFVYRATGGIIPQLFDVQVAVGMMGGEYPASYGKLLQRELGIRAPKGETRTNWRTRPLTRSQLNYAALDVYHLHALYDRLAEQLREAGRDTWLHDELLMRQQRLVETQKQEGWIRLSGVQALSPEGLSIARELWRWRERRAQQKNLPPRRVLRDDLIVELARRGVSDPKKIAHVRGLHHQGFKRFLPEIAQCIERGLTAAPPAEMPWQRGTPRSRHASLLQQFLSAAMAYLCRSHRIAPGIVGSSDDVGKLIGYWLGDDGGEGPGQRPLPDLLKSWRGKLIGEPLERIFRGQQALRVGDPEAEMPLELCDVAAGEETTPEPRTS